MLRARHSGQAMAEFALSTFVFFLLLFGILEMGVVIYRYISVGVAAREAARYAIIHSPNSSNAPCAVTNCADVRNVAVNYAPFLKASDVTVTFQEDTILKLATQQDAVVTITYNYTQNIPFMSAVKLNLTSSSQMLVSQ